MSASSLLPGTRDIMAVEESRWEKAVRFWSMKGTTVRDAKVVEELFSHLDDIKDVKVPDSELEGPDAELAKMFEDPDGPDDIHIMMETEAAGPEMHCLRDVVENVIEDIEVEDSPEVREFLMTTIKDGDYNPRRWILSHIQIFNFEDQDEVFQEVLETVLDVHPSFINYIIDNRPMKKIMPTIEKAITKNDPDLGLIKNVSYHGGDKATKRILELLVDNDIMLGEEFLPWLRGTIKDDGQRPLSLKLIERIEKRGVGVASGYLAFHDKKAIKRFDEWLDNDEDSDQKSIDDLVAALKYTEIPKGFPLVKLLKRLPPGQIVKTVSYWDGLDAEDRKGLLRTVVDTAEEAKDRFEALEELAVKGWLVDDEARAKKYLDAIEAKLKGAVKDPALKGKVRYAYRSWTEPIHRLEVKADMIPGLQGRVEAWVKDYLLMPSVAARIIPEWEPPEDLIPDLRKRIQREVKLKEKDWAEDQEKRRENPERYWYDDRKACTCSLFHLKQDWEQMNKLAKRIGGLGKTRKRMKELMGLKYYEVLREITDGHEPKL